MNKTIPMICLVVIKLVHLIDDDPKIKESIKKDVHISKIDHLNF